MCYTEYKLSNQKCCRSRFHKGTCLGSSEIACLTNINSLNFRLTYYTVAFKNLSNGCWSVGKAAMIA